MSTIPTEALIERLQHERDRHIDALEKLNFKVVFGAAALLAAAAFSVDGAAAAGRYASPVFWLFVALTLAGAVVLARGLVNHWRFRETQAEKVSELLRRIAASPDEAAPKLIQEVGYDFEALPPEKVFSYSMAIGAACIIVAAGLLALI